MHIGYAPILDAEMVLGDGRKLAYALWGDPDGETVMLFHGAPGSRLFTPDPEITAAAGVRLITVDRPGYGGSDRCAGRQILDWPIDVLQLADLIEAPRFAVVAHSSGGPYALACTLTAPDRVSAVALVSCVAPYDQVPSDAAVDDDQALTRLAQREPERAAAEVAKSAGWLAENPEHFLELPRPEPDVLLLSDPLIRSMFLNTVREAVKQGVHAYAWDCVLERRPWGFTLSDIGAHVDVWQGEQDRAVPALQATALVGGVKDSRLLMIPEAGHGLILARWSEILSGLKDGSSDLLGPG